MLTIFIDALSGDETARQHALWLLGRPAFWLVVIKWSLVSLGVLWASSRLLRARRMAWLGLFAAAVAAGGLGLYALSEQTAQAFKEGITPPLLGLRGIGILTDIVAVFVVFQLVKAVVSKRG